MTDALAAGAPVDRLARYFEYWILRLQGVYPAIARCPGCGASFDGLAVMPPRESVFVCRQCAPGSSGTTIGRDALRFLKAAGAAAPDRLASLSLSAAAGCELETAHRRLLNLHLEKELKSARVLREMRRPGA
jgi:recombinational DNA repair protein (RecF pathway)